MNETKKAIFIVAIFIMLLSSKKILAKDNNNKITFNLNTQKSTFEITNLIEQKQSLENLNQNKIQPGTSGYFDIIINSENYFSNFNYKILFSEEKDKPRNLNFIVDNTPINKLEEINIEGFAEQKTSQLVKRIYWNWEYETKDTNNQVYENDEIDTLDSSKTYEFKVTLYIDKQLGIEKSGSLPRTGIETISELGIGIIIFIVFFILNKNKKHKKIVRINN